MTNLDGRVLLVTGANGFIGQHTCAHLAARGALVRRATRLGGQKDSAARGIVPEDTIAVGDIDESTDWSQALEGVDTVVHLAARVHVTKDPSPSPLAEYRRVNVAGTRRLAEAAVAAGVRRLVLLSSTSVVDQDSIDLDETAPPRPKTPYGHSKHEAEQALLEVAASTTLEPVIVRAPPVYGPGNPGKLNRLARLVATGLPLPLGAVNRPRSWLYVGNLVEFLALCVVHPAAARETFLVSDGRDLTTAELVRLLGEAMDRRVVLVPVPEWLLKLGIRAVGMSGDITRLFSTRTVSTRKAEKLLAWASTYGVEEGLAATVRAPSME